MSQSNLIIENNFDDFRSVIKKGVEIIDIKYLDDPKPSRVETSRYPVAKYVQTMVERSPGLVFANSKLASFFGVCCIANDSNLLVDNLISGNIEDNEWNSITNSVAKLVELEGVSFYSTHAILEDEFSASAFVVDYERKLSKCNFIICDRASYEAKTEHKVKSIIRSISDNLGAPVRGLNMDRDPRASAVRTHAPRM